MNQFPRILIGHLAALYRYPVKSMQGENLHECSIGPTGLDGDRRFAVLDARTGMVASAKKPRWWGPLLALRAASRASTLTITDPAGREYQHARDDLEAFLTDYLGRPVTLSCTPIAHAAIEVENSESPGTSDTPTLEYLPAGSYCDLAPVHLVTTATLQQIQTLAPTASVDVRRLRPNLVIATRPDLYGFVESSWVGRTLCFGEVRLPVTGVCARCVMTTLAQPDLPADRRLLQTLARHNEAVAGVYLHPPTTGHLQVGQEVWLE